MGGLSSMLGTAGGTNGSGVTIQTPVTTAQANTAYGNAQTGLTQQQQFLQALQSQNGIGNQSAVFNQLQGVANGTGPNPAQAQLAQATGQNVANQSALMAGQRGSNANVGLMARQIGQQGAATQQQAVGQGATMQAGQSLNALNSLGNLATQQVGQQASATTGYSQAAQQEQSNLLNSIAGQNSANAGIVQNSTKSQAGLTGGLAQGLAMAFANGGQVQQYADGTPPGGATAQPIAMPNAPSSGGPQSSFGKFISTGVRPSTSGQDQMYQGGADTGSAIGKGISKLFGGGGSKNSQAPIAAPDAKGTPFEATQEGVDLDNAANASGAMNAGSLDGAFGGAGLAMAAAHGGKVPALVSPGEQYLPPKDVKKVVKEGKNPLKVGERIPGKPKVAGNSYANDVVPKKLETGGVVIPNSVMQSSDPAGNAAKFIQATLAKSSMKQKAKK